MKTKKAIRICLWFITIIAIVSLALMLICNQIVVSNAKGKVFSDIDSIKYNKVGLLLGTTPRARLTGVTNYFFIYRMDAAEQLYKAGKIEKILISGDEDILDGINEPECMRDSLVARGVPASAIILDGKGYRTICSVVNANKVYGLKSFTIISQKFHNERAIYQAEHLGLDVENIYNGGTVLLLYAVLTLTFPRDEGYTFDSFIGMDCPPPNWNEGLDPELTKDLHLISQFHNLFQHMLFAITYNGGTVLLL